MGTEFIFLAIILFFEFHPFCEFILYKTIGWQYPLNTLAKFTSNLCYYWHYPVCIQFHILYPGMMPTVYCMQLLFEMIVNLSCSCNIVSLLDCSVPRDDLG